jgi:hypothetical protein
MADPTAAGALKDLRRARRHNRLESIHWIDALYNVYLTAAAGIILVIFLSGKVDQPKLHGAALQHFIDHGPAVLGLLIAVAVAFGLRSGGRGGPLTFEAPVVQHEMLAPVPRELVVRSPAIKQLRFLSFAGLVVGAIVGLVASRQLSGSPVLPVALTAITFSLSAVLASACAMIACGRRLGWWVVNLLAVAVLAWSVADIATGLHTSPLTWLASVAFWSLQFTPIGIAALLMVAGLAVLGVLGIGSLSLEAARRRSGLVSQLRFAVTLQDVRTVVLLRRQLSQEKPRPNPWIRMRRGGRLPPVWRRDVRGLLRFPAVRMVRMALLGIVAGLCIGMMWRGTPALIVVAGLALYFAGYDAVEALAQEIDHPTRWGSYPEDSGRVLLSHLPAAVVAMLFVCAVTTATILFIVPGAVVGSLLMPLVIVVAMAAAVGAAVSTALGAPNPSSIIGLGPELMGIVLALRLLVPPAIVVVSLTPLLLAGHDPHLVQTARVGNTVPYVLFAVFGAGLFLRYRKPSHV